MKTSAVEQSVKAARIKSVERCAPWPKILDWCGVLNVGNQRGKLWNGIKLEEAKKDGKLIEFRVER